MWHPGTLTELEGGDADPIVDGSTTYQTFDGFGGTFNELSWRYLSLLSESDRAKALQLLFGADGARFVFGRLPIGANEYAADRYTLDMTDGNTPDPQLEKFSIQRDLTGLIPYVKAALALKPNLRFLAAPWTPPTWMKTNGDYDGGTMKDDATTLAAFALYLSKYVQEYAKQGINVQTIAVQREPSFTENSPSCLWSQNTYTKFVQTFLPETFSAQNIHAQLYLGLMENNTSGSTDAALVDAAMNDPKLMLFFSGFGFEWGMVDQVARVTPSNLPILQTEHLPGNFPWLSSFQKDKAPNDYVYATESWKLISQWLKAGATAYITKHLVLDSVGQGLSTRNWPQNSLLVVDTATHALTVTPAFYVFQHFSRFIAPGARRKAALTQLSTLDVLAFENPDRSVATVMFNSGAERELTVATGGTKYRFTLPANSFATVFKAAPAPIAR